MITVYTTRTKARPYQKRVTASKRTGPSKGPHLHFLRVGKNGVRFAESEFRNLLVPCNRGSVLLPHSHIKRGMAEPASHISQTMYTERAIRLSQNTPEELKSLRSFVYYR